MAPRRRDNFPRQNKSQNLYRCPDSRDRLSSDLLHRKKANYGLIRYRVRQQRCCDHLASALPGVRARAWREVWVADQVFGVVHTQLLSSARRSGAVRLYLLDRPSDRRFWRPWTKQEIEASERVASEPRAIFEPLTKCLVVTVDPMVVVMGL